MTAPARSPQPWDILDEDAVQSAVRGAASIGAAEGAGQLGRCHVARFDSGELALRGAPLTPDILPDLREDHHTLVHSDDPLTERYALVNVETDRITNSLNTLSEELLQWVGSPDQVPAGA